MLLPPSLERISGAKFREKVGIGCNDAEYVHTADGRVWIRKLETHTGFPEILAESIGWHLGHAIGVPIPPAGVCLDSGEVAWLSLRMDDVVPWRPVLADRLVNYPALGATATLDLIIMNADRNHGNLLLTPEPDEARLKLWAIDHGDALVGQRADFRASVDTDSYPKLDRYARALPVDAMLVGATDAADRAASLSEDAIRRIVTECCEYVSEPAVEELYDSVRVRCRRAPDLLPRWLEQLEAHR